MDELRRDPAFAAYFAEDFEASRYANTLVQAAAISTCLDQLSTGINVLQEELHKQVASRHEDLLRQATGIQRLEDVLSMITNRVEALRMGTERLKDSIEKPFEQIMARTATLARLQAACELLRQTLRFHGLATNLTEQLQAGNKEITKAAQTLQEIHILLDGASLEGIKIVDEQRGFVQQAEEQVVTSARKMLIKSIDGQNQTQMGTALQVFHNLDTLRQEVMSQVDLRKRIMFEELAEAFLKVPPEATTHAPVLSDAAFRTAVWTRVERAMTKLQTQATFIRGLQRVLVKKRSQTTHVNFSDLVEPADGGIAHSFWMSVCKSLSGTLEKCIKDTSMIGRVLESEYPRLLRLFNECWTRLQHSLPSDMSAQLLDQELQAFKQGLVPLERAYTSTSLARLFDPVNLIFPQESRHPPSSEEIHEVAQVIARELNVASSDANLMMAVARNVAKTVDWFNIKVEEMLDTSEEALTVRQPCTRSMQRNIALINRLYQCWTETGQVLENLGTTRGKGLSKAARSHIDRALTASEQLLRSTAEQIFAASKDHVWRIIDDMHAAGYQDDTGVDAATAASEPELPASPYVARLQEALAVIQKEIFQRFAVGSMQGPWVSTFLSDVLEYFLVSACTVDKLGSKGRLRLTADLGELEVALDSVASSINCKLVDLGNAYRALRALRPLLFRDPADVSTAPECGTSIPSSLVIHHLFSLVGPQHLASPRTCANMLHPQYSQWLVKADESARLAACKEALDKYAFTVTQRGDREFHPLYPSMLSLLSTSIS